MQTCIQELRYNSRNQLEALIKTVYPEGIETKEWKLIPDRWDAVDWTKSNLEIAAHTGVPHWTVRSVRKSRGLPNWDPLAASGIDLSGADWTKNNQELSKQYGVDPQRIAITRKRLGIPLAKKCDVRSKVETIDWKNTRDIDAGKILGVSRERARQLRNMFKKPACKFARQSTTHQKIVGYIESHADEIRGMTIKGACEFVSNAVGCALPTARREIARAGIVLKRDGNVKYQDVNFALPNNVLTAIWKCPHNVVASKRMLNCAGPAKWSFRPRSIQILGDDCRAAIAAEMAKARAAGIEVDEATVNAMVEARFERQNKLQKTY